MTAHANMQQEWIINKEKGEKTGLLIWDLSAAFDTLDIELLCSKPRLKKKKFLFRELDGELR